MGYKTFLLILSSVVLLSCGKDKNPREDAMQTENSSNKAISKKEIQSLKYSNYALSKEAQEIVSSWQTFAELTSQIDFLQKADFSFFQGDISVISAFLNDLKAEIPEAVKTNEIMARITVVETKALKLHSLLVLDNIQRDQKLEAIKELLIAYSNLNLQINKKLELEANNVSRPS